MKIELLHIAGCPISDAAKRLVEEILRRLARSEAVSEVEVSDAAHAQVLNFPGSPTIRVNGMDIEGSLTPSSSYGLSCRTYVVAGKFRGLPSEEMVRKAIQSAVSGEVKEKKS